mmetsp:Transcript_32959/g.33275  ORF Transcript_32959/g.33275 Transcript_32959/m.33275 type:complete len:84 (-) Transcript_32959:299-550(-)
MRVGNFLVVYRQDDVPTVVPLNTKRWAFIGRVEKVRPCSGWDERGAVVVKVSNKGCVCLELGVQVRRMEKVEVQVNGRGDLTP